MDKDDLKQAWENAKADQDKFSRNPSSPAAKRNARRAGIGLFVLGLVCAGINYATWVSSGRVWILVVAAAVTFVGLGIYLMVFGEMPGRK